MRIPDPFDGAYKAPVDLEGVYAFIGMPTGPDIPWQTVQSLQATTAKLHRMGLPHDLTLVSGCSIVENARNLVAKEFLASKATHLFMIDSDMQWDEDDFLKVLALATKMPIVCAAYVAKKEPMMFMLNQDLGKNLTSNEYGCLPVGGMGLGFCCVQRQVIEALEREAPKVSLFQHPTKTAAIFQCDIHAGEFRGEDIRFFQDALNEGYQCWLEPNITLGHVGTKVYSACITNCLKKVEG